MDIAHFIPLNHLHWTAYYYMTAPHMGWKSTSTWYCV